MLLSFWLFCFLFTTELGSRTNHYNILLMATKNRNLFVSDQLLICQIIILIHTSHSYHIPIDIRWDPYIYIYHLDWNLMRSSWLRWSTCPNHPPSDPGSAVHFLRGQLASLLGSSYLYLGKNHAYQALIRMFVGFITISAPKKTQQFAH